jgi:N-acyl-D-aspartate/D-glutamate deacylase
LAFDQVAADDPDGAEYLAWLEGRRYDIDVAALVPHAALRVFVMGERGVRRDPATPEDRAAMGALLDEAIGAGAIGIGTFRTMFHRSSDGADIATFGGAEEELGAFADVLRRRGSGMLQVVTDFSEEEEDFALLRRLALRARCPVTFSLARGRAIRSGALLANTKAAEHSIQDFFDADRAGEAGQGGGGAPEVLAAQFGFRIA